MGFVDIMENYIEVSDNFDCNNSKISAYIESVESEFNINIQRSELKVMKESGTYDDLLMLEDAAEEGAIVKLKKVVDAIIEAFKEFIKDLKDKVVRIVVNKTTRQTLSQIEKKVKLNPFLAKKKVKVIDKKKPLAVINKYKGICDKNIAQVKAGVFKQSKIEGIYKAKENYEADYKKAVAGTAAVMTITVAALIAQINKDLNDLPNMITKIDKETTEIVEKFCQSVDEETAVGARAAFTACANFRTKLGKAEANEHVDSIMDGIRALKNEVKGLKPAKEIQESVFYDDYNLEDSYAESAYDEYDSDSLLRELEDLI